MKRDEILSTASSLITGDRAKQYGNPNTMFSKIGSLWSAYLEVEITAVDVAHMMALFKIAREQCGKHSDDNAIDACGYLALGAEMSEQDDLPDGMEREW